MAISEKIRRNVKIARLKKSMSQGKIAKMLGVHPTYISQIERDIRNPKIRSIERIAKTLGVSVEELMK